MIHRDLYSLDIGFLFSSILLTVPVKAHCNRGVTLPNLLFPCHFNPSIKLIFEEQYIISFNAKTYLKWPKNICAFYYHKECQDL